MTTSQATLAPQYRHYLRAKAETDARFARIDAIRVRRYGGPDGGFTEAGSDFESRLSPWACEPREAAARGLLNTPAASPEDVALKLDVLIAEHLVSPFNEHAPEPDASLERLQEEARAFTGTREAA